MAAESNKGQNVGESLDVSTTEKKDRGTVVKKKQGGVLSRIWNGVFRIHGDDFEKRLQHISKEEAAVLARMKKRSRRRMTGHLILFSVIFEVVAVGYAIMTTRSLDLNWKMKAFRLLPMFLLPGLSFITYSALASFTRMRDRKDQKILERLRAERQEKIDELKEKTNYYNTQQLIQRYDSDPAAKAAAASVLASKLGSDSGLKVYVGDESKLSDPIAKINDVELVQSSGLRNRKQLQTRYSSPGSTVLNQIDEEMLHYAGNESPESSKNNQLVVEHHHDLGSTTHDGGWIARIAALLVGEDPTESYALICGNCHMHNGLARKEDFPYITYYCPHCNALNRSKQLEESGSVSHSPNVAPPPTTDDVNMVNSGSHSMNDETSPLPTTDDVNMVNSVSHSMNDKTSPNTETVAAAVETKEISEG